MLLLTLASCQGLPMFFNASREKWKLKYMERPGYDATCTYGQCTTSYIIIVIMVAIDIPVAFAIENLTSSQMVSFQS